MTSEQLAEFKKFGDRVSRDTGFIKAISTDNREAHELSSRLSSVTSRAQRAEAAYSERIALAERLSAARERGETISIDIAQDPHNIEMFRRYSEEYGGSSASAFALLDSELARQGLRPNRVFSDGTALPASFSDIRNQYTSNASAPQLTADINAKDRENASKASGLQPIPSPSSASAEPATPALLDLRQEISAQGSTILDKTGAVLTTFDNDTEIVKTPDGTLASRKSLAIQTGKQVAADAEAAFDNVKDTVKNFVDKNKPK